MAYNHPWVVKWSEKSWSGRDFTTIADLEPWKLSQQKRVKCEMLEPKGHGSNVVQFGVYPLKSWGIWYYRGVLFKAYLLGNPTIMEHLMICWKVVGLRKLRKSAQHVPHIRTWLKTCTDCKFTLNKSEINSISILMFSRCNFISPRLPFTK